MTTGTVNPVEVVDVNDIYFIRFKLLAIRSSPKWALRSDLEIPLALAVPRIRAGSHITQPPANMTTMMSFRVVRSTALAARFAARPMRMLSSIYIPPPPTSHHRYTPLEGAQGSIVYTETDEAPALATYSLLPVISKVSCQIAS